MSSEINLIVVAILAIILALGLMCMMLVLAKDWLRAMLSGAPILVWDLIGMRLRGNPPSLLVDAYVSLKLQGHAVSIKTIESIYIANRSLVMDSGQLVNMVLRGL
jgi:uncharacterized protein YqfA (UPF0365 family)